MIQNIAIIGAGTLGDQLRHYLELDERYTFAGFFDDILAQQKTPQAYVLGSTAHQEILQSWYEQRFDALMMGIGYNHLDARQSIYDRLIGSEVPFLAYAHKSVVCDPSVQLEPGAIVFPGCILDRNVSIRGNTLLNTGCVIAHDTSIGPHTFLGPAVQCAGFINITEKCFIGLGSTIIDGRTIGPRTQTGGGTVVTQDLDSGLWVGVPARKVRD